MMNACIYPVRPREGGDPGGKGTSIKELNSRFLGKERSLDRRYGGISDHA
jgi:hypothetical protein